MSDHHSVILIVDDNEAGLEALADVLEPEGHRIVLAASGPEALALAASHLPDLILLDVMMPGMDGFEVCRRLRADVHLADVPVVMVTALDDRSSRLVGIEAGADDFISKPFDRLELRARVRTITRLNRYRKLRDEHAELERAYRELAETHDATLEGWVRALDLRDKETEGHSRRVVVLTERLALAAGVPGDDLEHVLRGALLHDVGKLGVPDAVLLKPGPLTPEERTIIEKHPVLAYEWLSRIPYLRRTAEIPYAHHERWDGSGYPQGLAGDDIPLAARLFSVADVWDALRSDRPHRLAWSVEKTLRHIRAGAGSQFDPQVVDLFLDTTAADREEDVVPVADPG